jgi:hypothetical protein
VFPRHENYGREFNASHLENAYEHVTYHDRSQDPSLRLEGDVVWREKCASLIEGGEGRMGDTGDCHFDLRASLYA